MKGKYYVEVYDGDRRRSLCLGTDNYELACQRYAAGLKELRKRIRKEHEATKPSSGLDWLPEQVEQIKANYPEDFTPQQIAELETGKRAQDPETGAFLDERTERLAEQLIGIRRLTWQELVANAATVRRRKQDKDYAPSWYRNVERILKTFKYAPIGLTPQQIRAYQDQEERKGIDSVTLKNRLSALQGLVERAITSGYAPELAPNVFKMVDFSVSKQKESKRNYYCPTEADYRKLFQEVLPEQPERIAVGIELMAWTGCRVSALPYHSSSEQMGWLEVPDVAGTKGGGRVPVPPLLWNRGRDLKISWRKTNAVLKQVHPKLCNHGLRSGFKMLTRMAELDYQLGESLLMHKLSGLESTYGGKDFPDEAKLKGSRKVWAELEKILSSPEQLNKSQ